MFDSHPQLAVTHEAQFISRMGTRRHRYETDEGFVTETFLGDLFRAVGFPLLRLGEDDVRDTLMTARPTSFADAIRRLMALYARHQGKPRYGDKTPRHALHIPLLSELFGEARFVHIIRDGRDASFAHLDREFGVRHLSQSAVNWRSHLLRAREAGRNIGAGRYRELRYEDLVNDPTAVLVPLCAFLGLDYDDKMLQYYERADAIVGGLAPRRPGVFENIARPPTKGLRDWRRDMSRDDAILFEVIAGDLLTDLGYERLGGPVPPSVWLKAQHGRVAWQLRRGRALARRYVPLLRTGRAPQPRHR